MEFISLNMTRQGGQKMKYANQIICMLSFLVWSGLSAVGYGNPQSAQDDLSEDSPTISKPRSPISTPEPKTEYSMKIIKLSPWVDYKMMFVTPDPSIHYTITNYGPKLENHFTGRNYRYGGTAR